MPFSLQRARDRADDPPDDDPVAAPAGREADVGIPAQVFTHRPSMPYEVRVCGAEAGLVRGGDGLAYSVADGLEALEKALSG